jgi:hypothetical protein
MGDVNPLTWKYVVNFTHCGKRGQDLLSHQAASGTRLPKFGRTVACFVNFVNLFRYLQTYYEKTMPNGRIF